MNRAPTSLLCSLRSSWSNLLFFHHRDLALHAFAFQLVQKHRMNLRRLLLERNHLVQLGAKTILAEFRPAAAHGEVTQGAVPGVEVPANGAAGTGSVFAAMSYLTAPE